MKTPLKKLERNRKWNKENPEKRREYTRRWRALNPEKVAESHAKWYAANKDRELAYQQRRKGLPEPTRSRPKLCECCGRKPNGRRKSLHLDHDHDTGEFRGWLCFTCNTAIGKLGDSIDGLMKAVRYLKEK